MGGTSSLSAVGGTFLLCRMRRRENEEGERKEGGVFGAKTEITESFARSHEEEEAVVVKQGPRERDADPKSYPVGREASSFSGPFPAVFCNLMH